MGSIFYLLDHNLDTHVIQISFNANCKQIIFVQPYMEAGHNMVITAFAVGLVETASKQDKEPALILHQLMAGLIVLGHLLSL